MSFQRMIAIPQEEYIQLSTLSQIRQPYTHKMMNLEREYEHPAPNSNPYERMMLQGSVLEEMKSLKERIRNDLSLGTPKPYRNRALSLYRSIEPVIKFNERGELIGEDEKAIQDSRAEDLIQHAVRDHRRPFTPVAWNIFVDLLKKHNVPRSVLSRQTLAEMKTDVPNPIMKRTPHKTTSTATPKRLRPIKTPKRLLDLKSPKSLPDVKRPKRKRRQSLRYPATDFLLDYTP